MLGMTRRMICVFGGREFVAHMALNRALDHLHGMYRFTHLLHGNARGADTLADQWARAHGVQPVACDALWEYYRGLGKVKVAGKTRNGTMLELEPDFGLCCPGGNGTADMLERFLAYMAMRADVRLYELDIVRNVLHPRLR
jgi:hypothetical protein